MAMIRLTRKRLAAAYDCLRAFKPFCNWDLPPAADVTFQVLKTRNQYGLYTRTLKTDGPVQHFISVSSGRVGHLSTLMLTMAHEMLHLHQAQVKAETPNTDHNGHFRRLAADVCRRFGFDPRSF